MGRQMGICGHSRAWRAIILACGLALLGPVAGLKADTLNLSAPDAVAKTAEPFGLFASPLESGGLLQKWLGVQRLLDDELVQLALCDGDGDGSVFPAALQFLTTVDSNRAPVGLSPFSEFNRA